MLHYVTGTSRRHKDAGGYIASLNTCNDRTCRWNSSNIFPSLPLPWVVPHADTNLSLFGVPTDPSVDVIGVPTPSSKTSTPPMTRKKFCDRVFPIIVNLRECRTSSSSDASVNAPLRRSFRRMRKSSADQHDLHQSNRHKSKSLTYKEHLWSCLIKTSIIWIT